MNASFHHFKTILAITAYKGGSNSKCQIDQHKTDQLYKSKCDYRTKAIAASRQNEATRELRREEIIIEPAEDTTDCKKMGEEIPKYWNMSRVSFT